MLYVLFVLSRIQGLKSFFFFFSFLVLCVCIAVFHILEAGLLARSQYPDRPATGHLGTGFSWFPCFYK